MSRSAEMLGRAIVLAVILVVAIAAAVECWGR